MRASPGRRCSSRVSRSRPSELAGPSPAAPRKELGSEVRFRITLEGRQRPEVSATALHGSPRARGTRQDTSAPAGRVVHRLRGACEDRDVERSTLGHGECCTALRLVDEADRGSGRSIAAHRYLARSTSGDHLAVRVVTLGGPCTFLPAIDLDRRASWTYSLVWPLAVAG